MKVEVSERRATKPHGFRAPLRVRVWRFAIPESRAESKNLSEKGIFFATDFLLRVGTTVEILLKALKEITGEPTTERPCAGHVVRVEPTNPFGGKFGGGAQFDRYQILRPQAA